MNRWLKDLKKYYKYVIYASRSGLKAEVANSRLSWLWWILDPLLFMGVYWFLSQVIFGQRTRYYLVFVFVGLNMWDFFQKTILTNVKVVTNNSAIVTKIYIPKYMLVLIEMIEISDPHGNGICTGVCSDVRLPGAAYMERVICYSDHDDLTFDRVWNLMYCCTSRGLCRGFAECCICRNALVILYFLLFMKSHPNCKECLIFRKCLAQIMIRCNTIVFLITECREVLIYGGAADLRLLSVWFLIGLGLSAFGIHLIYQYESDYVKVL